MTWLQRYRLRRFVMDALWIMPMAGMLLALAAVPALHALEAAGGWESTINPETARTILGTMAASMFTFIVFICSALLLAVQLASAQLTPRIIGLVFRDPVTKYSLTVFVFTFTFALAVLARVNASVPALTARLTAYMCLASLGVFLLLIDHVGRWLRPSGAVRTVSALGHRVIENVYPIRLADASPATRAPASAFSERPTRIVTAARSGVVLAYDVQGLVALAQRADCVIEMVQQVGDFIAEGTPLFRLYHGGDALPVHALRQSVAVGQERTLEQDPALAFRILVDIAAKGLSPAINDPTTAVLALDQIHHLLRHVGNRHLDDERVRDAGGQTRLLIRTPSWKDFVQLAVTEIRHFGGESIQIRRRLRAMLEDVMQALPQERAAAIESELCLLRRSTERFFTEPEDRAMADVSDFQGVGGQPAMDNHRPSGEERLRGGA